MWVWAWAKGCLPVQRPLFPPSPRSLLVFSDRPPPHRCDEPCPDGPASLRLRGPPSGQALPPAAPPSLIAPARSLLLDLGPGVSGKLSHLLPSLASGSGCAPAPSHPTAGTADPGTQCQPRAQHRLSSAPCGLHGLSRGGVQVLLTSRVRAVLSLENSRVPSAICSQPVPPCAYDVRPSLRPGASHRSPWSPPPACCGPWARSSTSCAVSSACPVSLLCLALTSLPCCSGWELGDILCNPFNLSEKAVLRKELINSFTLRRD